MKFVDRAIVRMVVGCPNGWAYVQCKGCTYNLGSSEFIVSCSAVRGENTDQLKGEVDR